MEPHQKPDSPAASHLAASSLNSGDAKPEQTLPASPTVDPESSGAATADPLIVETDQ